MKKKRTCDDQEKKKPAQVAVRKKFQDLGIHLQSRGGKCETAWKRQCKVRAQSLAERRKDLQKARRYSEQQMRKNGGPSLQRILLWERELVLEQSDPRQNQNLGDKNNEAHVQEDETWKSYRMRTARATRNYLEEDTPCHILDDSRKSVESHGLDKRHKAKAKCGPTVVEIRLHMEKYDMVEKYRSPECDGGLQQQH